MKSTKLTNKFTSGETDPSTSFRPGPSRNKPIIICAETSMKPHCLLKEYPSGPVKLPMYQLRKDSTYFIPVSWASGKYMNALVTLILGSIWYVSTRMPWWKSGWITTSRKYTQNSSLSTKISLKRISSSKYWQFVNLWLTLHHNKNSATSSKSAAFSTENLQKNRLIIDFANIPNQRIPPWMKTKNNCRQICAICPSIKSSSTLKAISTSINLLSPDKWKPLKIFLSTNQKSNIKTQSHPERNRPLIKSKAKTS